MIDIASEHALSSRTPDTLNVSDAPLVHVPLCKSDARRSLRNILNWNSYLPTDCVRMMVSMGWDYTT